MTRAMGETAGWMRVMGMGKQRFWPWVLLFLAGFVLSGVLAASYITPVEKCWGTVDQLPMTELRIEHGHVNLLRLSASTFPVQASVHACRIADIINWEVRSDPAAVCYGNCIRMGTRVASLTSGPWGSAPFMRASAGTFQIANATFMLVHTRIQVILYALGGLVGLRVLYWLYRLRLGPREGVNRFLRRIPRVAAMGRRRLVRAGVSLLLAVLLVRGSWVSHYRPLRFNRGTLSQPPITEVCLKDGILSIIQLATSSVAVLTDSKSRGVPGVADWEYRSDPATQAFDLWIEFPDGELPLSAVAPERPESRWRFTLDGDPVEPQLVSNVTYRRIRVWLWAAMYLLLPLLLIRPLHALALVPLYRRLNGLCRRCGYDLTGNLSGVCPECGGLLKRRHRPPGPGTTKGTECEPPPSAADRAGDAGSEQAESHEE